MMTETELLDTWTLYKSAKRDALRAYYDSVDRGAEAANAGEVNPEEVERLILDGLETARVAKKFVALCDEFEDAFGLPRSL